MKRMVSLMLVIVASAVTMLDTVVTPVTAQGSPLERNKALAQRFHLEIIQKADLKLADEIIAPDCVFHLSEQSDLKGPERAKQIAAVDHKAFPKGIKFEHDVVFGEGDLVAFHWILLGTRASGEVSRLEGIDLVRIANGKIAEVWIEYHTVRPPKQ